LFYWIPLTKQKFSKFEKVPSLFPPSLIAGAFDAMSEKSLPVPSLRYFPSDISGWGLTLNCWLHFELTCI
ncbi:hypothetical protein ACQP3C_28540, partial [Escherichia coli]